MRLRRLSLPEDDRRAHTLSLSLSLSLSLVSSLNPSLTVLMLGNLNPRRQTLFFITELFWYLGDCATAQQPSSPFTRILLMRIIGSGGVGLGWAGQHTWAHLRFRLGGAEVKRQDLTMGASG